MTIEDIALERYPVKWSHQLKTFAVDLNKEPRGAFAAGFNFAHQAINDDIVVRERQEMDDYLNFVRDTYGYVV